MRLSNKIALLLPPLILLWVLSPILHTQPSTPTVPYRAPHPPIDVQIPAAPAPSHSPTFRDNMEKATVRLYADLDGKVQFICTTTAIEKNPKGYVFLSARHCVSGLKDSRGCFVMLDEKSDTPYTRATVLLAGGSDTDAALLQVNTAEDIPTIPLGDEKLLSLGSPVEYFGFPQNLGRLYFEGYVSTMKIGPPAYTSPQWDGDLGVTMPIAPGSSGSALVDPNQEAIVGVVTGATTSQFGGVLLDMVTPASKVRALVNDYKTGRVKQPEIDFWGRFFKAS